jgi:hypothetical protein
VPLHQPTGGRDAAAPITAPHLDSTEKVKPPAICIRGSTVGPAALLAPPMQFEMVNRFGL